MKRIYLLLVFLTVGPMAADAANDFGLPGEFMNFGVGARPLGLGRAFTAVADDVDSIYWNPAGLSTFRSSQITFQYSPLSLGGAYQYLAYAQPLSVLGNLGLGVVNINSGDISRRDSNNIETGNFTNRETGYFLSYAYRIKERIALGGTFKVAETSIDDRSARGFGADLGVLYVKERVRLGGMVRNMMRPGYKFQTEEESFPRILRVGGSAKLFRNHLLASLDLDKTLGVPQGMKWHFGIEGTVVESILLRLGIDQTEITTGFGVRWKSLQLDYGAGFQNLGLSNRISVKFYFGGFEADAKASPRVFSPVGLKNKTTFKVNAHHRDRIVNWVLAIRRSDGAVVRSFSGFQSPPKFLEWDGKNAEGKIVDPGEYTYRMSITDTKNITELTQERNLKILAPLPFEIEAR